MKLKESIEYLCFIKQKTSPGFGGGWTLPWGQEHLKGPSVTFLMRQNCLPSTEWSSFPFASFPWQDPAVKPGTEREFCQGAAAPHLLWGHPSNATLTKHNLDFYLCDCWVGRVGTQSSCWSTRAWIWKLTNQNPVVEAAGSARNPACYFHIKM